MHPKVFAVGDFYVPESAIFHPTPQGQKSI